MSFSTPNPSHDQQAAARAAKVTEAQATLVEAVKSIQSGDDWRHFLDLQSRLHSYSANNAMLIAAQHARAFKEGRVPTPEPSYVAGFRTWKGLGRSVEKGQKGYMVLAPLRSSLRVATDQSGGSRVLGPREAGQPGETVEARRGLRGFTIEHVFAAEQTTGAPLPTPPSPRLLEGDAPLGLGEAVVGLIEARGYVVSAVPDASAIDGANGMTTFPSRTVQVRADMDDAARVKTLLHEAAHVLLHDPAVRDPDRPRHVREVEAESVAYVVASVHGMATDSYSFPYVAGWAGAGGVEVLQASMSRIAQATKEVIAASPAEHGPGGRVPGAERAVERAQLSAELLQASQSRLASPTTPARTVTARRPIGRSAHRAGRELER